MNIRLAHKSDVAALVALDAPYVENTAMTFECQLSSTEEFANRIEKTLGNYFDLVVEEEGLQQAMHMFRLMMIERHTTGLLSCRSMQLMRIAAEGLGSSFMTSWKKFLNSKVLFIFWLAFPCQMMLVFLSIKTVVISKQRISPKIGYKFECWHDIVWLQKSLDKPTRPIKLFKDMNVESEW